MWKFQDIVKRIHSGNGVCLSLREMALLTYNNEKELAGFVYDEPWDAEYVLG